VDFVFVCGLGEELWVRNNVPYFLALMGALADFHRDAARNVVSLVHSQDLFDDLTDDPAAWVLAQRVEAETNPPLALAQYRPSV